MLDRPTANLSLDRYAYAAQAVSEKAARPGSCTVFDIGAHDGRMKEVVEACGYRWCGFDLRPEHPDVVAWDLTEPCPLTDRKANVVMLLDVIEHLVNPGIGLRNVRAVTQPGGALILTAPNPRWSRSRIHALLHGNPACFTQSDLDLNGHVFTPWPHILVKILADTGWEVVEFVTLDGRTTWPDRPLSPRYPLRLAHAAANKAIEWFDASACGMSFGLRALATRNSEQNGGSDG